jgi:hypothetical protein
VEIKRRKVAMQEEDKACNVWLWKKLAQEWVDVHESKNKDESDNYSRDNHNSSASEQADKSNSEGKRPDQIKTKNALPKKRYKPHTNGLNKQHCNHVCGQNLQLLDLQRNTYFDMRYHCGQGVLGEERNASSLKKSKVTVETKEPSSVASADEEPSALALSRTISGASSSASSKFSMRSSDAGCETGRFDCSGKRKKQLLAEYSASKAEKEEKEIAALLGKAEAEGKENGKETNEAKIKKLAKRAKHVQANKHVLREYPQDYAYQPTAMPVFVIDGVRVFRATGLGSTESDAELMAICEAMSIIGLMGGYLDLQITKKELEGDADIDVIVRKMPGVLWRTVRTARFQFTGLKSALNVYKYLLEYVN